MTLCPNSSALASRRPAADRLFDDRAPLFGHSVMRSFLEAYQVLARVLHEHPQRDRDDEKELIRSCMKQGEEMLLRRRISSASALSEPLFATARKLANYRGLLAGPPVELEARRGAFAVEIADATHAIDLLQRHYDQHQELACDS